jgi:hypothetical protein
LPAIRMAGHRGGLDGFATKCVWHEHVAAFGKSGAVALMADVIDEQPLSHGARREKIRCCRRRR